MPKDDEEKEISAREKKIPKSALKRVVGLQGTKAEMIEQLRKSNPKLLAALAEYHSLNRERSLFVFKTHGKVQIRLDDPRFRADLNVRLKKIGASGRFEVTKVSLLPDEKEVVLAVRYEADAHVDAQWDGPPHEHRPPRTATVGLPLDGRYVKIHTRSSAKAREVGSTLGRALFGKDDAVKPIVLSKEEQEKRFGPVRARVARITNLDLAGAKEIIVKGSDVEGALLSLKQDYGLDFEKMGATIQFDRTTSEDANVRMSQDGRITFNSAKIDRDEFIMKRLPV